MSPIIAQLAVAAFQALVQALESKLSQEEKALVLLDPDDFVAPEEQAAFDLVKARARRVWIFGRED